MPASRSGQGDVDARGATVTVVLPNAPVAARIARELLRQLTGSEDPKVALVATELVTNAVRHSSEAPALSARRQGEIVRIEVHDGGPGMPVQHSLDPAATSGRGMALVAAVSEDWGVEHTGDPGKTVWAEVRVHAGGRPGG